MELMEALLTRNSAPPKIFAGPGPSDEELKEFLKAAVCAPDHGAIRPWRFRVIRGEARKALGQLFVDSLLRREPDADEKSVAKQRDRPLEAGVIVAVCAKIVANHPKVPPVEQILAAGLAADAILLAAQAKGYGGILLTGKPAYDPVVKAAFGLADKDAIVGFIFLGGLAAPPRAKRRPDPADFTSDWTGAVTDGG